MVTSNLEEAAAAVGDVIAGAVLAIRSGDREAERRATHGLVMAYSRLLDEIDALHALMAVPSSA